MTKHWSDEDLIDRLYGIGREDSHLDECAGCCDRWERLLACRAEVLEPPHIAPDLLARQRSAILEKIEYPRRQWWPSQVAPALAALSMVVLAAVLWEPAAPPAIDRAANDAKPLASDFYTEIYTMVESPEPWAAEPMVALFED